MKKIGIISVLIILFFVYKDAKCENTLNESKTCNFFLLKEVDNKIIIEKATITEGQVQVFKDDNIITYIPVFAPGSKSGEKIKKSNRINALITQLANGKIKITAVRKDGSQIELPDIDLEKAYDIDIRINITGGGSYRQAYRIEKYETIINDDGPVINIFQQTQLEDGDYVLVSEMMETTQPVKIAGEVPYQIYHNWITTTCKLPNGESGLFVVDLGASNTVISKESLPAGAEISKYEMVAYSGGKKETKKGTPDGASGAIEGICGVFAMDEFSLGNIHFTDVHALVMEEFPKAFTDLGVNGIIGRDLLMQTDYLEIRNLNLPDQDNVLVFSTKENAYTDYEHIIPYTLVGGHIFVDGSIDNHELSFFFDSGATSSSISEDFLKKNNIPYVSSNKEKKTAYGLDGKGRQVEVVTINNIQIGDIKKSKMEFNKSDVFALKSMGIANNSGLIGMNFLLGFNKVCFDFHSNNIMIWEN